MLQMMNLHSGGQFYVQHSWAQQRTAALEHQQLEKERTASLLRCRELNDVKKHILFFKIFFYSVQDMFNTDDLNT